MKSIDVVRERESSNLKIKKLNINPQMKIKSLTDGVTLIALIVTIIVLLILAGVTVATLTGENGLLGRASNAREETRRKTAEEKINLKITTAQIKSYTEIQTMPTLQYLADEFYADDEIEYVITKDEEVGSTEKTKIIVGNHDVIYTKLTEYPYEFGIDKDYKLASINGVKIAAVTEEQYQQLKDNYDNLLDRVTALENANYATKSELSVYEAEVNNTYATKNELNGITASEDYSTDVQEIGTWTDDKPLYRIVINGGAISSGNYIDLSSYNIDTLVYYYVMFSDVYNNNLAVSSAYKDPWCNVFVTYNIPSQKLNVSYSDFTPTNSVFIIEYTKKD